MIYLFTFLLVFLAGLYDLKKPSFNIHSLLLIVIFISIIGLRYDVGTDYFAYYDFFGRVRESYLDVNFEPGFSFLIYQLIYFGFSAESIMLIIAFASMFFTYLGVKSNSKAIAISLMIYFCLYLIPMNFNAIGQGLSIALFLFSLKYILSGDFFKVLIISLVAFSLHSSGIFILLAYAVSRLSLKQEHCIAILSGSLFLVLVNNQISSYIINSPINFIANKVSSYSNLFEGDVSFASYLIRLFIFLPFILYYKRLSIDDRKIFSIYLLSLLLYGLLFFNGLLATRVNLFFKVLDVILLANFIMLLKYGLSRFIGYCLVAFYCFLILSVNFGNENIWNYKWISNF
jgi:hypothetical protein